MTYTYTEHYQDGTEKKQMWAEKREKLKEPIKIIIEIEIDAEKYTKRRAKYKDPIWVKIGKFFGV